SIAYSCYHAKENYIQKRITVQDFDKILLEYYSHLRNLPNFKGDKKIIDWFNKIEECMLKIDKENDNTKIEQIIEDTRISFI
ncbi:MAG: hypothetical protein OQK82_03815, partial [Candidatus Pacearchaeota archaeon]|nr:hypothetical protein [Candidatus Pacearchaeota archaeon]